MDNDELEKLILNFNKQGEVSPAMYISRLLKEYDDYNKYLVIIKDNLVSNDIEKINDILDFLGYLLKETGLIPGVADDELVDKIDADDEVFQLLEKLVFSDKFEVKLKALSFYSFIEYEDFENFLEKEFNNILRKDPLLIPDVIAAVAVLKDEIPWDLINILVKSDHYSIRWSFFYLFSIRDMDYERTYDILNLLKKDKCLYIQAEAVYYGKYLELTNMDMSTNSFLENYCNKHIEKIEPEVTYRKIKEGFISYMNKTETKEYSLELFEEFIEFYIANKDLNIVNAFIKAKVTAYRGGC